MKKDYRRNEITLERDWGKEARGRGMRTGNK
jgi:hypothetical protein